MNNSKCQIWIVALVSLVLLGCASSPTPSEGGEDATSFESQVNDPLEGFNRTMWTLNYDYLDPYLVRPVSLAYVNYVPNPLRHGVSNFLGNLDEPFSVVNNLLVGNGIKAVDHFNRFWINSTFGLLGLIDVASAAGITDHNEKAFSDVVGYYGVGDGPYVMVPGYGPWTVRESTDLVDSTYLPLSLLNFWAGLGKWAIEGMETRAALVSQEALLDNSPDPYALTRDAYLQRQDFKAEVKTQEYDADEEAYLDDYLEEGF
ncbi:VacJ family lipoprotein [Vibrio ostreicida]|uniref:VacJ family lipoprotein n=1 Tax=Vibrio ostreicida TaxID=526588 RepID=A0ABT8BW35_9VIBR|nr:VacJ family lipoprotein [Vibrio ostreicida]MDN3610604.1 VacJ family lipoprotein [Vibrio ostreicida]NPD07398.1 VacJ family lipoprotein [Vibrio ostreicida]